MDRLRMVRLVTAHDGFHARVLAARLGSEGIVTQLRGPVEGPYPMGPVEVLVGEEDLADARELLLADEVEAAFDGVEESLAASPDARERWLLAVAMLAVVAFAVTRLLS